MSSVGPLGRLGRLAFRRRGTVVLLWLAALLTTSGFALAFAGDFTADYSVANSDSQAAQSLLEKSFPAQSGASVTVVVRAGEGVETARSDVGALLSDLRSVSHVTGIDDPYARTGSISPDGRTLITYARLDVAVPAEMPVADSRRLIDLAEQHSAGDLQVALGGPAIAAAEQGAVGSEGLGIAAAAVILLLTFGSVVAAGLPIVVAVAGLAVSSGLTGLVILLADAPEWSTSLATMMGIGIGLDYVLLMVTRFREWRAAGLEPEAATVATLDTAGRSVVVAGTTVVVSMLGLFAMGVPFMRGAALVTITAVLVTLLASITLFPALLGYLGRHVDRLRLPLGRRRGPGAGSFWLRWSRFIERRRFLALGGGIALLLAVAAPFLGVRFGFPDAGNNPGGAVTRQAYDLAADGFGPGANGPLLLAAELPAAGGAEALDRLRAAVAGTDGVASVSPPQLDAAGDAAVLTVVPVGGPQDQGTADLVTVLRDDVIPSTDGLTAHVGGVTATSLDSTADLAGRIPYLIAGVVTLSMLLLLIGFRSIAVAVKAALLNLLSVAAAYGVVGLVLQGGWAGQLIGIDTATPLPPFIPVLMFAVLFGLSMDYEVFLVSRMREVWTRTGDNHRAVTDGLAGTARVISAAAAIMIAVFAAFVASPEIILKVIGIGMAAAILLDATVIRLVLVPAAMHILGRFNWWIPSGLRRLLPELHIEGRPEVHLPA